MGNYQICDFCGNLHEKTPRRMCQHCEQIYQKIRSVVEVSPDIMVLDISNQTGISVSRILSFVKNGFFIMKDGTMNASDS